MSSSSHCILHGKYTTLKALTKSGTRRRPSRDDAKPALPELPKSRRSRRAYVKARCKLVKRMLKIIFPKLRVAKKWSGPTKQEHSCGRVAKLLDVPTDHVYLVMMGVAGEPQCNRIVTAIEKALKAYNDGGRHD